MGWAPPWLLPGMRLYTISSAALDLVFSIFASFIASPNERESYHRIWTCYYKGSITTASMIVARSCH